MKGPGRPARAPSSCPAAIAGITGHPRGRAERPATFMKARAMVVRALSGVLVTVAMVVLAGACTLLGSVTWSLPNVNPFGSSLQVIRSPESATTHVASTVAIGLAAAATAGLMRPGRTRRAGQAVGGVVVLAATWLGSRIADALRQSYATDPCRYDGCWPHTAQSLATAAPAVALGVAMLVAALVTRWPDAVRTWVPPVVWLVLVAAQRAAWDPVVLPFLTGPPP